jgi:hypothetical protein
VRTSAQRFWGDVDGRQAGPAVAARERFADELTVIVPAYNEAGSLADTVKSLVNQTCPPARVLVVDHCSTDGTGEVATAPGVEVLRPPAYSAWDYPGSSCCCPPWPCR